MTEIEQQDIFHKWLDEYKALLFKIVRSYAFNAMDRDDLFQEILIQIWNSVPAFRQEASVSTWLYRISFNTAIKWTGKEQKHTQAESIDNIPSILQEHTMQVYERLTWLYEAIYQLNKIDRSIALLLLDGFSYKEMAVILGITESNIGVKINRIKKQLIIQSKKGGHHGI